ncbi:MAG: hypothetical protein U9O82_13385 [Thermodesulfobacteriota bacterium]|nr:hypothetical protein [Thermodesulfobacteriota bacterium]
MEIAARQQFGLPFARPLFLGQGLTFRAVPIPAGVVAVLYITALAAYLDVTSQFGSAALTNVAHNLGLLG